MKRFWIFLLLVPCLSLGLSLGPLQVSSYLNQPLKARIAVTDLQSISSDQINVGLAGQLEFAKANMAKTDLVRSLHLEFFPSANKTGYIEITTKQRLTDPFIGILVKVSWPEGDFIKKYVILLDPASYRDAIVVQKKIKITQREILKRVGNVYGPTTPQDTLWKIAREVRPNKSVSVAQTALALVQYNPNAFTLRNMNGLMSGYYLRIPTRKQIAANSPRQTVRQMRIHKRYWRMKRRAPLLVKAAVAPTGFPTSASNHRQLAKKQQTAVESKSDATKESSAKAVVKTHVEHETSSQLMQKNSKQEQSKKKIEPKKATIKMVKPESTPDRSIKKILMSTSQNRQEKEHLPVKSVAASKQHPAAVDQSTRKTAINDTKQTMKKEQLKNSEPNQSAPTKQESSQKAVSSTTQPTKQQKNVTPILATKKKLTTEIKPLQNNKINLKQKELQQPVKKIGKTTESTNSVPFFLRKVDNSLNQNSAYLPDEFEEIMKLNQAILQQDITIEERLQQLQTQNQNLLTLLLSSKQTISRLQQLVKTQNSRSGLKQQKKLSLAQILRKQWGLVLAVGAIFILSIIFIIYRRSRKNSNDDGYTVETDISDEKLEEIKYEDNDKDDFEDIQTYDGHFGDDNSSGYDAKVAETENINDDPTADEEDPELDVSELLAKFTVKEIEDAPIIDDPEAKEQAEQASNKIDAMLHQGKLYLDYGRQDQADELLHELIDSVPATVIQWENLMRLIAERSSKKLFAKAVAKIPPELISQNEQGLWQTVEHLREELGHKPDDVAETDSSLSVTEVDASLTSTEDAEIDSDTESSEEQLNFKLPDDVDEPATTDATDEKPQSTFVGKLGAATPTTSSEDTKKSFDIGDIKFKDEDLELEIEIENEPGAGDESAASIIENEGSEKAKLDLIKSYIKMEDNESAKKLIDELVNSGNASAKKKAEELLKQIDKGN